MTVRGLKNQKVHFIIFHCPCVALFSYTSLFLYCAYGCYVFLKVSHLYCYSDYLLLLLFVRLLFFSISCIGSHFRLFALFSILLFCLPIHLLHWMLHISSSWFLLFDIRATCKSVNCR